VGYVLEYTPEQDKLYRACISLAILAKTKGKLDYNTWLDRFNDAWLSMIGEDLTHKLQTEYNTLLVIAGCDLEAEVSEFNFLKKLPVRYV